jgi:hypothetical protein
MTVLKTLQGYDFIYIGSHKGSKNYKLHYIFRNKLYDAEYISESDLKSDRWYRDDYIESNIKFGRILHIKEENGIKYYLLWLGIQFINVAFSKIKDYQEYLDNYSEPSLNEKEFSDFIISHKQVKKQSI